MNTYIARRSLDETSLIDYTLKAQTLDDIYHRIGELEDTISALDDNIAEADRIGLDEVVDTLSKSRNDLNLSRLKLELQANKLERELLEFEANRMMTR